jgi:HEAT repeat protein
MDAWNSHGVREKCSWALTFTALVAACLALAECGGWAQGKTVGYVRERIQRLGDKHPGVRSEAALDLGPVGRTDAKEAVPALIAALAKDTDPRVRDYAAQALRQIGTDAKEAVPALITALAKDTDPSVRRNAAEALGWIGPDAKEAVPALITALAKDTDPSVRDYAARALDIVRTDAKEAVPALIAALAKDTDLSVRGDAALTLGRISRGMKEAVPALITALAKDADWSVRASAAYALGQIGTDAKEAAPYLVNALAKDTDLSVRGDAARALTQIAEAALNSKRTDLTGQLTQWAQALEASSYPTDAAKVRTAVDVLRAIRVPWYEVLYEKAGRHPGLVGLVAAYLLVDLLWLALLWMYPLAL